MVATWTYSVEILLCAESGTQILLLPANITFASLRPGEVPVPSQGIRIHKQTYRRMPARPRCLSSFDYTVNSRVQLKTLQAWDRICNVFLRTWLVQRNWVGASSFQNHLQQGRDFCITSELASIIVLLNMNVSNVRCIRPLTRQQTHSWAKSSFLRSRCGKIADVVLK